jgi:hypothetical protein
MILAGIVAGSFWCGVKEGRKQAYAELITTQGAVLRFQQVEKEMLQRQTVIAEDRIRSFLANRAHEDLIRIEAEEKKR